jgi:predicted metal-dependent enzyme (double-stranded beta helix superfamily)
VKRKKLLETIGDLLDQKKSRKLKRLDELKTLLAKLAAKKVTLKKRVALEKNKQKRERISKKLGAVTAQLAKGSKHLRHLERS